MKSQRLVRLTGTFKHMGLWLTSGFGDLTYRRKLEPESKIENHFAIYCIHGTADRRNSFSKIAKGLLDYLPEHITSVHLLAFRHRAQGKSIEFFAKQLKNKIVLNKHQHVILMGHSRGCLVSSYFAEFLASANDIHVHSVINICGPFGGSQLASSPLAWFSHSVKEMQIHSAFLFDLREKMKTSNISYYYFAAEKDTLVSKENASIKEHQNQLITLDKDGHLSIMTSEDLIDHIKICIQNTVKNALTPHVETNFTASTSATV